MDYEILVFSDDWFGLPFSCKHLLQHFLPDRPLIWVETIGLRSPRLNLYDIKRTIGKISGWLSSHRISTCILPKNLHIIDPIQIPYNHINFVRKLNKRLLIRAIDRLQCNNTKRERVLITIWPFIGDLVGCLGEQLSIYYRVDDFSELPGVHKESIIDSEKKLIEKVDMVVATSENLTKIDIPGKLVKYLPHGVDFEHFSFKRGNTNNKLPIQQIPPPRIGFFGLLNSWIDFELLSHVAANNRQWSFVFIGPSQIPLSSLPNLSNMHFLGPVSYEELPTHAQYFNVALIPFKVNSLTRAVNPLKLLEYFAIGLPVISSPLPEVMKYQNHVMIASGYEDFCYAIKVALERDSQELMFLRQEIAKEQSWEKKSFELKMWIEEFLERKNALSH